jgi:hypothetical protein
MRLDEESERMIAQAENLIDECVRIHEMSGSDASFDVFFRGIDTMSRIELETVASVAVARAVRKETTR